MMDKNLIKNYCLKNKLPELISYLKMKDKKDEYYSKFVERFVEGKKIEYDIKNQVLIKILHIYEEYYVSVFYKKISKSSANFKLWFKLCLATKTFRLSLKGIENHLKKLFNKEGYEFRGGKTSSYYGPYVWNNTAITYYKVEIPEEIVEIPIYFMKGYIMNSWLEYISLGVTGTGGFSTNNNLFCNYERYKDILDSPKFTVSFLKHEAQHHLDLKNKKYCINPAVLEYRAKLTELAYYPDIELFKSFLKSAKNDLTLYHSVAEYWIVSDLSKLIFNKEYENDVTLWQKKLPEIKKYSRQLLLGFNRCKKNIKKQRS